MIQLLCFHPLRRRSVPPRSAAPPALSRLLVRRGLTLVEMLISMAITLVMMAAVVNLFANISASVRDRRAMLELGSQLRSAREQLTRDLANATCPALTWQQPGEDNGYIEIIEGVRSDFVPLHPIYDSGLDADGDPTNGIQLDAASLVPTSQIVTDGAGDPLPPDGMGLGDFDDILALTVRSNGEPFVGRRPNGETVESDTAEIIWFAVQEDGSTSGSEAGMRRIYRRVFVVAPWIDIGWKESPYPNHYYQYSDISAHWEDDPTNADPAVGRWVANTLGDLTKRENRCYRPPAGLGVLSPQQEFPSPMLTPVPLAGDRLGQDLMLDDALAFDIRVYDPGAPLVQYAGGVLQPGDAGWYRAPIGTFDPTSFGAFVDLGWNSNWGGERDPGGNLRLAYPAWPTNSWPANVPIPRVFFGNAPDARSKLILTGVVPPTMYQTQQVYAPGQFVVNDFSIDVMQPSYTYDTWSYHYEVDGIDTDEDGLLDEGANGFDDLEIDPNNPTGPRVMINGVDDPTERETAPPYDVPLRGIQVKLRVYEREARQVREATAVRSFVP